MKLAPGTRVQLVELPDVSTSLLATLGGLLGLRAEESVSITDLPAVRDLLHSVPASMLVSPEGAQARLPYQLSWD
jgi:hypothetical protein